MLKNIHEIRDPIHVFVRLSTHERRVLDSRPFQRLRHIHQLALTYLVYPGATHKRFEHSLGVMELAGRVYDVITRRENLPEKVREFLPEVQDEYQRQYWHRAIRMAALCHDLGHLPFSHAAEKELLPEGWKHERLTARIIRSPEMDSTWSEMRLKPDDIVKLALGPSEASKFEDTADLKFSTWETILSEIVVGDAFGVDRMDYLLRDSHHAGVAYGKFDHHRLIDTLRILPPPPSGDEENSQEPALGVEEGGIQSAEALMLARYFMYSQVYFHSVRRIYDIHLKDFLKEWLDDGAFSTDLPRHLGMTDSEVTAGLLKAAYDGSKPGHLHARRIIQREHFKRVYQRSPDDVRINPEAGKDVFEVLRAEFGTEKFRHDRYPQTSEAPDFPVLLRDGQIVSSRALSETLNRVPVISVDYVFADQSIYDKAKNWIKENRTDIIQPPKEETDNG